MNQRQTIKTYLTGRDILSPNDLPIGEAERTGTDTFCTIITAVFALALFVTACIQMNPDNLANMTYPTDSMGRKCTKDNPNYNYLYFTSIKDQTKRVCVSECPKGNESSLKCWPTDQIGCSQNSNPDYQVDIYASVGKETKLGLFCLPEDQTIKDQIVYGSGLDARFKFIDYKESLIRSLLIAMGLGIFYLILVMLIPRPMVFASIILGALSCIVAGIFMFINLAKFSGILTVVITVISIVLIAFFIFLAYSVIFKRREIGLCGDYVANSIQILSKEKVLWLMIPLFMVLSVGLFALGGFQIFASWSSSQLVFSKQNVYYEPVGTFKQILKILIIIEMLWGFFFLKEAYSFVLSACAVTHHFLGDSRILFGVKNLFKFHWGSVVAGSFLANFFYLPDILFDLIKPSNTNSPFYSVCCCCDRVFGFVRSEAVGFINMVGLPFCNSSRWCEKINGLSEEFQGSQSINRYFRMGSHAFLALLGTILGFIQELTTGNIHPVGLIVSFIINLFLVTYIVCLPAEFAETNLMCNLTENYILGQKIHQGSPPMDNYNKNMIRQSDVNDGYEVLKTHPN